MPSRWYQGFNTESWINALDGKTALRSRTGKGRYVKVNWPNYQKLGEKLWLKGPQIPGEGVYACFNTGSCVAPDTCVW